MLKIYQKHLFQPVKTKKLKTTVFLVIDAFFFQLRKPSVI